MLTNTFLHLPRIGERSEQNLWKQGVRTWSEFINQKHIKGIHDSRKPGYDRLLQQSMSALREGNSSHFCCMPSTQTWRLWKEYRDEAALIDIETNHHHNITVLGISDGQNSWQFLRHHNMDKQEIARILKPFKLLVTFNGASFDLPIINRYFQGVLPEVPHLDLRHAGARAGLHGGLKKIEQEVGIARADDVEGIGGADAVALWRAYRATGHTEFRDLLLQYNEEDIINLRPLADIIYGRLEQQHKTHFLK